MRALSLTSLYGEGCRGAMLDTLARCCEELLGKMEAMAATAGALRQSLENKSAALSVEMESVVLLLLHLVMALAKCREPQLLRCLVSLLRIASVRNSQLRFADCARPSPSVL